MMIFVDGFSHYTDPFMAQKWDIVADNASAVAQSVSGVGRFGGGGVVFTSPAVSSANQYIQKNYDGVGTIIAGLAFKQSATQNVLGGLLCSFLDGATVQVALRVLQSGQVRVLRNNAPNDGFATESYTVLGESTNAIASSSFDFLEIKVVHHPTAGSVEIKRNGSPFFTLTNKNTAISGVNNSSSMILGGYSTPSPGSDNYMLQGTITDVYLLNTLADGGDPNAPVDFIGDRHWEPLTPTADGADTAWTTTGSANHFANVDEIPPNTTDFNSTDTLNARDGFVVSSPTGPGTATAIIAATMFCQKNTGGSNAVKAFMRSAGGSYQLGSEFQVPTPWGFRQSFMSTKPGGGAITIADIGTHQTGYQKTI